MGTWDDLEKQWRIVVGGGRYELRRVGITRNDRAVLLGDTPPSLESSNPEELCALLSSLAEAADAMVLRREDLVSEELFKNTEFVVQERHYYNDFPTYVDICGPDELPLGFATREAAQAYIDGMLDADYTEQAARYERDKVRADQHQAVIQARKAVLEEHGLWDKDALGHTSWRTPRPAVRASGENYLVVPLAESAWARED